MFRDGRNNGVADLRKKMHVLMAVDEIRRAAERVPGTAAICAAISACERFAARAGAGSAARNVAASGRKAPSAAAIAGRQRPERRGQRHMQTDRDLLRAGI